MLIQFRIHGPNSGFLVKKTISTNSLADLAGLYKKVVEKQHILENGDTLEFSKVTSMLSFVGEGEETCLLIDMYPVVSKRRG